EAQKENEEKDKKIEKMMKDFSLKDEELKTQLAVKDEEIKR
ncbi:3459_t:CDS:1, partial [Gigaspora rosea]